MRFKLALLTTGALLATVSQAAHGQSTASAFTHATRYDAARRVTGTIAPDPDGSDGDLGFPAVRNTYDAAGRLEKVESGQLSSWQDESIAPAKWTGFEVFDTLETKYDDLDRKTVERRLGKAGLAYAVTQFSYNNVGLLHCTAVRMNSADFASPPSDVCGQTQVVGGVPDRITRNTYDKAGQLLSVEQGVGSTVEQVYVSYEYTDNGKRKSVTDANGNRAEMRYDGFDRQSMWIFPFAEGGNRGKPNPPVNGAGGDYEAYGYDANGNRTSLRKRSGQTISFIYDALNRVAEKRMPADAGARSVYYGYDLRGLQTSACFDSATGSDCVKNEYDGFGRIVSTTTAMGSFSKKLTFSYDANGNRTGITHPDNIGFTYTFDGLNRLGGIKQGETVLLAATYNSRGGLKVLDHKGSPAAVQTKYEYDDNGRLYTQELTAPGLTTTLTYNAAGQISSRALSNLNHAFKAYANFTRGYKVNGLNQYSESGVNAVGYDANGNLTSVTPPGRDPESYTYDIENRLLTKGSGTLSGQNPPSARLIYDPLGRLFSVAENNGTEVRFLYDGDQLSAEYDAAGNLLRRYLHGFGDDDPLIWYEGAGLGERRILQANHQGSIVAVVAASGALLQANGYDEYGITNPDNMGRFQFTGQAWFNRLGLYHYKARFYSPTMGRFLQTDPIGYDDQINLYAYVANDPVNKTDPTGESCTLAKTKLTCTIDDPDSFRRAGISDRQIKLTLIAYTQAVKRNLKHPNRMTNITLDRKTARVSGAQVANGLMKSYVRFDNGGPPKYASMAGGALTDRTTISGALSVANPKGLPYVLNVDRAFYDRGRTLQDARRTFIHEGFHTFPGESVFKDVQRFNSVHSEEYDRGVSELDDY